MIKSAAKITGKLLLTGAALFLGDVFYEERPFMVPVHYNNERVEKMRRKRFTSSPDLLDDEPLRISFTNHYRDFNLILQPISPYDLPFSRELTVIQDGVRQDIRPHKFLFEGFVEDDPNSLVYGSIFDGVFDGNIQLSDGNLYSVTKYSKLFDENERPNYYHSGITHVKQVHQKSVKGVKKEQNIKIEWNEVMKNNEAAKEKEDDKSGKVDNEENNAEEGESGKETGGTNEGEPIEETTKDEAHNDNEDGRKEEELDAVIKVKSVENTVNVKEESEDDDYDPWYELYINYVYNELEQLEQAVNKHHSSSSEIVKTCSLHLKVDHNLFSEIMRKEGNNDPKRAQAEILSMCHTYIKAVNDTFANTDFNENRRIQFVIKQISIDTGKYGKINNFKNSESENYLINPFDFNDSNSQGNHSDFCLSYVFTYREFELDAIGVANIAHPGIGYQMGLCGSFMPFDHNGVFINRSENTGAITLLHDGDRVPDRNAQIALAHELGHSFGADHDVGLKLFEEEIFLMAPNVNNKEYINTAKFSKRSISQISYVLDALERYEAYHPTPRRDYGAKRNCLQ